MKWKGILIVIIVIITVLILWKSITPQEKIKTAGSGSVNYAPDGYKKTIEADINSVVSETKQSGLFWVTIKNTNLPFSYDVHKFPEGWEKSYPPDFIQVGDSIFKKANTDTFYLVRNGKQWMYVLPK